MVVGCAWSKDQRMRGAYRGVFAGPFDYDMAVSARRIAGLKAINGSDLTAEQEREIGRLEQLEELGGIDRTYLMGRSSAERLGLGGLGEPETMSYEEPSTLP